MEKIQVAPVPEAQKNSLFQLARDFRTALSYVSFYSTDSPFVIQSVHKLHKDLQRLQEILGTLVFHVQGGNLYLNDTALSDTGDLPKLLHEKNSLGVEVTSGVTPGELMTWLKQLTLPVATMEPPAQAIGAPSRMRPLTQEILVEIKYEPVEATAVKEEFLAFPPEGVNLTEPAPSPKEFPQSVAPFSMKELSEVVRPFQSPSPSPKPENSHAVDETLLSFVAEAWQHSQAQKKSLDSSPESVALALSFDKLFDRLLDRMEKTAPDLADISRWFKAPSGELMEGHVALAMLPLLEVAVKNGWTSVLFDPSTEGLVGDCLARWGADGKEELVEKAVSSLAEGLSGGLLERQLALSHLMDARPWAKNTILLEKVLSHLNALLAQETYPAPYQSALLLAWDLTEPAMASGREGPVLTLLSTLHFHADEDSAEFPERAWIARHWLFERSNPDLVRHLTFCAFKAGHLSRFPLLGEMAAPILLRDFLASSSSEKVAYLPLFSEIREPFRSTLAEILADGHDEQEVRPMLSLLRTVGIDPGLSLQLCSWVSRGSLGLRSELISLIEEIGDPAGGPALRLALFDDNSETAALAARVMGKIRFTAGIPVLLKAAKIRGERFTDNEVFLSAVCRSFGEMGDERVIPFLEDLARKHLLLRAKNYPTQVRLAAIEALARINRPEVWKFLETLASERNESIQGILDKIIQEKTESLAP